MKKTFFSIATLFVAAAISVAVVSCQKDKETENENQTVVKSSNDDAGVYTYFVRCGELSQAGKLIIK